MKLAGFTVLAFTLPLSAQTVHWEFNESTGGEDITWVSPTAVDPQADQYDYVYDINYLGIDVVFLGIVFGPFDVTNEIDPKLRHGEGISDGPAPIVMMDETIEADADGDSTIDFTAHILMQLNAKGNGQLNVTDIFLGTVFYDMGWPFGVQEVQIDRIYMSGQLDLTSIILPCPEDINGDGTIDVTDLLIVIGNWGRSGDGDVTGDGMIDVSDILAIVGAWGPC